jgi:sugar-specific transcriptional regulator TrmB
VTGYQLAKELGKDPTSVYRALDDLRRRGAVETTEGRTTAYRPVAAVELLRILKRDFWARSMQAREQLAQVATPPEDAGIYRLQTRAQTERLGAGRWSRRVALLDLAPRC